MTGTHLLVEWIGFSKEYSVIELNKVKKIRKDGLETSNFEIAHCQPGTEIYVKWYRSQSYWATVIAGGIEVELNARLENIILRDQIAATTVPQPTSKAIDSKAGSVEINGALKTPSKKRSHRSLDLSFLSGSPAVTPEGYSCMGLDDSMHEFSPSVRAIINSVKGSRASVRKSPASSGEGSSHSLQPIHSETLLREISQKCDTFLERQEQLSLDMLNGLEAARQDMNSNFEAMWNAVYASQNHGCCQHFTQNIIAPTGQANGPDHAPVGCVPVVNPSVNGFPTAEELEGLRVKSASRTHFATLLTLRLFSNNELVGRNCRGVRKRGTFPQ